MTHPVYCLSNLSFKVNFILKTWGVLKYFLGIEAMRSKKGGFMSQRKYVLDLLSEIEKLGVHAVLR